MSPSTAPDHTGAKSCCSSSVASGDPGPLSRPTPSGSETHAVGKARLRYNACLCRPRYPTVEPQKRKVHAAFCPAVAANERTLPERVGELTRGQQDRPY